MPNYSNQDFAIILAAGLSTRMGVCKTSLPWHNNKTLLRYQAEQFLLAGITPIIVLGSHNAYRRSDCPPGSRVAINFNCKQGKTSSIITGLNSLPQEFFSITISAVDQPRSSYIYQTLLNTFQQEKALITAPSYSNKLGHPLLFSAQLLPLLKDIHESSFGLRKIVRQFYSEIKKIEFATSEILSDLNDRDVYRSELQRIPFTKNCS
jgi:molybdenum cofactor cytidylyltransferase